ncbi:MAG: competence/damage-inducible protein A [Anaerolineaceae bacterium]
MPSAELITIGTELLLGEIQDTNTQYLAKKLKSVNIDLFRSTTIGDNANRIAELVNEALSRSDIVITTGGLGPTVDDPTRDAIALAFKTKTIFIPDLWQEIEQRFLHRSLQPTENNRRQAFLPLGAEVIHNPVGTAPAFSISQGKKIVICLPGVPREMETLTETVVLPLLKQKYDLQGMIKIRVIHLSGIGESVVDEEIGEYETLSNPTVGLLAHPGIVDIRITAKANTEPEADKMISNLEKIISTLFPDNIFGYDDATLYSSVLSLATQKKMTIEVYSSGLEDVWSSTIFDNSQDIIKIQNHSLPPTNKVLSQEKTTIQVDCLYTKQINESKLELTLLSARKSYHYSNIYNGPTLQGPLWAINIMFDKLRRLLLELE